MKYRNRVLGLLSVLMVITYLDRVCISVAGPRMQSALNIGPIGWSWVTGCFTLAYAVFEIPSGAMGDRIGPRQVLTRIVLWWSAFTSLTGMMTGFYPLLATRFFFGMGEAGAFPNASVAVARWFPVAERGRAFGTFLMASQLGGALAPLLVVPIQVHYGWRASFYVFGVLGVVWSAVWYVWFRDTPAQKAGVSAAEREETRGLPAAAHRGLPWGSVLRKANLWAMLGVAFCYVYTFYFFQSWLHTFLVKSRGYSEKDLLLSSLPFLVGAGANFCGGLASSALVRQVGLRQGRRAIGVIGLGVAAACIVAAMFTHQWLATIILLSLALGGITFQQPTMFAVCLDTGGEYAGAVVGAMNTAAQIGSLVSTGVFGYLVGRYGNYDLPFVPMAALLITGAWLWMKVDAAERLVLAGEAAGVHSIPAIARTIVET
jgi:ACS family glucarate transporter-like MFS transporter